MTPNLEGKIILIAEDDPTNMALLKVLFSFYKANLMFATDGQQAVDLALNNHVDLIMMDIKMPVMSGLEASKIIKANKPKVKIIAQTAFAMSTDRDVALKSGCDDFISKPILSNDLNDRILKIFKTN